MAAPKVLSGMNTRQKVTTVVFIVIVLILLYMVYGMFKGESTPASIAPIAAAPPGANPTAPGGFAPSQPQAPKPAQLPQQPQSLSPREAQLLQMQQETEAKYLDALNELQMLKLERDIAETNKAIAAAKLDTITAQTKIVSLLKPPVQVAPGSYAQGLVSPTSGGQTGSAQGGPPATIQPPPVQETNYTVISVSLLQSQWNAVIGYQGNLYSVHVGDVLPIDGSKVLSIDKSGLILERNGVKRKLSMVPII